MQRFDLNITQLPLGTDGFLLGYRGGTSPILVGNFIGATGVANGQFGSVPAPLLGQQTYFLCGDGTWKSTGFSGLTAGRVTLSTGSTSIGDSADLTFDTNTLTTPAVKHGSSTDYLRISNGLIEQINTGGYTSLYIRGQNRTVGTGGALIIESGSTSDIGDIGGTLDLIPGIGGLGNGELRLVTNTVKIGYGSANTGIAAGIYSWRGNSTTNNGQQINITGGAGYPTSGNGNGGSLLLTSGIRRIAGSGVDGDISLNSNNGFIKFTQTPLNDDALTQVIVRDNANGNIKYRTAASLSGLTGLVINRVLFALSSTTAGGEAGFEYDSSSNLLTVPNITTNRVVIENASTPKAEIREYNLNDIAVAVSGQQDTDIFVGYTDAIAVVEATIIGVKTDGTEGYGAVLKGTFRKDGAANNVQVGSTTIVSEHKDDLVQNPFSTLLTISNFIRVTYSAGAASIDQYHWSIFLNIKITGT